MKDYKKIQPIINNLANKGAILTGFFIPITVSGMAIILNTTAALSCLTGNWKEKIKTYKHNAVLQTALLLFLLFALSILYSSAPFSDTIESLQKYSKLLYLFFLMPLFMDEKQKRYGINAFLFAMVVTVGMAFLKRLGLIHLGVEGDWGSLFTNHINTSFMIAFASFIILHRSFISGLCGWFYRVLFLIFMLFLFFMNAGRTGYIIFFALIVLFLWQKLRWKGVLSAIIVIPIFIAIIYMTSITFKQHVNVVFEDYYHYQQHQLEDNSTGLRWQFAKHTLMLIKQHPMIGTGLGSFRSEYREHFPPDPGFANMAHPQNEYLFIMEQLGIVGLVAFLGLLIVEWRASKQLPWDLKNYAQGMILAFAMGCASDSFLYIVIPGYFFVYFSALFFSTEKKSNHIK